MFYSIKQKKFIYFPLVPIKKIKIHIYPDVDAWS